MKNNFTKYLAVVLVVCIIQVSGNAQSNGVINQLMTLKQKVEHKAAKHFNDADKGNDKAALEAYVAIKILWDAAISQFQYDLNRKPGLGRKFDKINSLYIKNESKDKYFRNNRLEGFNNKINLFVEMSSFYLTTQYDEVKKSLLAKSSFTDFPIVDVVSFAWTFTKDVIDLQRGRAAGVASILETLRLASPKDLKS